MEAIPGYLSLHQTADIMTLKWTPNQLMNGSVGDLDYEKRWGSSCALSRVSLTASFLCSMRGEFAGRVNLACASLPGSVGSFGCFSNQGGGRPC